MSKKLKTLILAGGSGTRLWPISRQTSPKQFAILEELGGKSLFQLSLIRAAYISNIEDIYVVAAGDHYFHVLIQAEKIGINLPEKNIIMQPCMKETLPIIALATQIIGNANILVMPSDHLIDDNELFKNTIGHALTVAQKGIITFGIHPTHPETGYGYIEKSDQSNISKVHKFHEKPKLEKAKKYIKNGYKWNAGIFLYDSDVFIEELKVSKPDMYKLIWKTEKDHDEIFQEIEAVSIDFGLLEDSKNIYCVDFDSPWNDLGSFDSIGEYMQKEHINHKNLITEGKTNNNIILCEQKDKEIALIDVEDLIIVDSPDVLMISKRGSTQKIKSIVKKSSKINGDREYRPWGSFEILSQGNGYKTKRIVVLPGKKLSLQSHNHRSEHWVVVNGTANATLGEKEILMTSGESIYVPIGEKHRLENPGKIPLIVIESQIGGYLGEDDIIRYSDDFGRA